MILLGIDYGRRRIGLALAVEGIIETRGVIDRKKKKKEKIIFEIKNICQEEGVEKIIIGMVPGKMGAEIKEFERELERMIKLPIEIVDETLTSWQAEKMVGWRNKERVETVAAALILERYLDQLIFS